VATTPNFGWDIPDPALAIHPALRDVLIQIDASMTAAADYVVVSDGGDPPIPLDDGFGNFIYVLYAP